MDFKKHYGKIWEEIIKKTIKDASEIFKKEFGIKIVLEEVGIENVNESKFEEIFNSFPEEALSTFKHQGARNIFFEYLTRKVQPENYDIIIIFLKKTDIFTSGLTDSKKHIVLYNQEKDLPYFKVSLVHELGHCFGIKEHSKIYGSIMCTLVLDTEKIFFDKESKKTILKNKWKKFR